MEGPGRDGGGLERRADPGGPHDPALLRISDSERHAVAEVLREAAGEGRIDLSELDERLEATYAARTYADLVPITADLPHGLSHPHPQPPPAQQGVPVPRPAAPHPVVGPAYGGSAAVMSETRRSGPWQVGEDHWAVAVMGSVVLDLREALFRRREVVITANALMGGVEVVVGPDVVVFVEGVGVMGDFSEARSKVTPRLGPDSRVVRVRGLALMGSVVVRRKEMPGEGRGLRRSR